MSEMISQNIYSSTQINMNFSNQMLWLHFLNFVINLCLIAGDYKFLYIICTAVRDTTCSSLSKK